MKFLNSGNVIRLPLDQIKVEHRLRAVRDAQLENLIAMAEDTGITTPIHVRKVKSDYVLIDGAHRVEASRRMGLPDIAALVVECRADEARAMEASNNLGAARMTPLQTAVFVASWKQTYYEMHPDRKPGVFKGNQYAGKVVSPENGLTNAIAESFGRKRAQIYKIMSVGERLTAAEVKTLDGADFALSLDDLEAIGKISDGPERAAVVDMMARGTAKKVAEARRKIAEEKGVKAPVKDPVEEAFIALSNHWLRAPMAAKRRFVEKHSGEIGLILGTSEVEG